MFWGCTFWGYQRLCMAQIGVLRAWISDVWAPAIIWHLLTHLSVFQGTNTLTPSVTHSLVVGQGIRCSSSSSLAQRCTSKWCKWCKRWAGAMARLASRKWIDSSGPYGDLTNIFFRHLGHLGHLVHRHPKVNGTAVNKEMSEGKHWKSVLIWQWVKTLYPFCSHQNSWDLWMFIPLKMVFS